MMRRLFLVLLWLAASLAFANETFLGLYVRGSKLGYVSNIVRPDPAQGSKLTRSDTKTVIGAGLLGQSLQMEMQSSTWTNSSGSPQRMTFSIKSGGRSQLIKASFSPTEVRLTIDNSGTVTEKTLAVPKDGRIVDDAVNVLLQENVRAGALKSFYVLDPMTATLVKTTTKLVGKSKALVRGISFDATLIEVAEPRVTMKVYMSAKGDLIKIDGPMGIEMIPVTKEEALKPSGSGGFQDLAVLSRLKPDRPLGNVDELERVKLRITGASLTAAPIDAHQQVQKSGSSWVLTIQPVEPVERRHASGELRTLAQAAAAKPEWVKPTMNIPADSQEFRELAASIIGDSATVASASEKVREFVTGCMKPNAGIGVLRDASEVLRTKEGVCRDYAILTATLMRAANVPARLVSGLVYQDGAFYYHAWVEAFDGERWVGYDSTRPNGRVTAGHVKLAQGSVEEAFLFTFLGDAKVEVLETKKKGSGD